MRHAVIWGRRRQGKSTLALALAAASGRRPVIIFDPCDQFQVWQAYDVDMIETALADDEAETEILRIVPDSDPEATFSNLMEVLDGGDWYWSEYCLLVDESSMIQKPQMMNPWLARLIRQAPDDIVVIQTIHRPSETHSTVKALASDYFFFSTYLQRDLLVIEQTYGQEVSEAVSKLGKYEVLHFWLDQGGEPRWKVWRNPGLWYMPLREE